jgi:hypothetical protein
MACRSSILASWACRLESCLSADGHAYSDPAYFVPDNDGSEDTSVQLLQLSSLIFGSLVVGLGHIEISLRVGDPLCLDQRSSTTLNKLDLPD